MSKTQTTKRASFSITGITDEERWKGRALCAEDQIDALTSEIERLRVVLQRLADCDWVITPGDRMDAVRKIARDALGGYLP